MNEELKENYNEDDFFDLSKILKDEYTCFNCNNNLTCKYAYDYYNINGDCLAVK